LQLPLLLSVPKCIEIAADAPGFVLHFKSTLLPRFARDAVILLDQIHLRFSCPPFNQRQFKTLRAAW